MAGARAWLYDGCSAVRHEVAVHAGDGMVEIAGAERFAIGELTAVAHASARVFGRARHPGWRLGFDDEVPGELAALGGGAGYGRWIERAGLWKSVAAFGAVSAAIVALVLALPGWIAPLIPYAWEQKMGAAMAGDLGGRFCRGPGGQAALDTLARRVAPGESDLKIYVVHVPLINAVTLPGGTIVIFDGLLKQAKSPDELAGVLGHEIGHVRHRDTMQALVRQMGLGVMLGGLNSNVGNNLNLLLSARYSRAAETAADDFAIQALRAARIAPADTAALFGRLAKEEKGLGRAGDALAYVASHPVSTSRQQRFAASGVKRAAYRPALDADAWGALADICHNDPARQRDYDWSGW